MAHGGAERGRGQGEPGGGAGGRASGEGERGGGAGGGAGSGEGVREGGGPGTGSGEGDRETISRGWGGGKRGGGAGNNLWRTEVILIALRYFEYSLFIMQESIWTPRLSLHIIVNKLLGVSGNLQHL